MKLFILILVCVASHLCLAEGIAVPLRMISDGTHTVACIERKVQKGDDEYEIRICRTDGQTHTQESVCFESPFQFTKGFCSDNFIALTNTGTDETPAMCVFDLANNTVVVAAAAGRRPPDRCPVQWKYDAGNQLFEVSKSQGSGASVRYEVRQYPVQKKLHFKVIFRAETE